MGTSPAGCLPLLSKKLGRRRNAAHIKTVKQFFYAVYIICCAHEKVNPKRNIVSGKFLRLIPKSLE